MKNLHTKIAGSLDSPARKWMLAALSLTLLASASPARAEKHHDHQRPQVPPILEPPADQKVVLHAFAVGVQIYTCTASTTDPVTYSWVFKAPEAVLFKSAEDALEEEHVIALHYAGPTWEYKDGSKVVGAKLAGVTVDTTAIPWLLLQAVSHDGEGKFDDVTYIQRVNTVGGKAPTTGCDAAHVGQEVRVPYMAEYFFYREK